MRATLLLARQATPRSRGGPPRQPFASQSIATMSQWPIRSTMASTASRAGMPSHEFSSCVKPAMAPFAVQLISRSWPQPPLESVRVTAMVWPPPFPPLFRRTEKVSRQFGFWSLTASEPQSDRPLAGTLLVFSPEDPTWMTVGVGVPAIHRHGEHVVALQ